MAQSQGLAVTWLTSVAIMWPRITKWHTGTIRPPFPVTERLIEPMRLSVTVLKRFIESIGPFVAVLERFIVAIRPSVPVVGAMITIEPIKTPVIAIGSPVRVRVGAVSVEIAIRIIIVPVVRTRISRADARPIMNTCAAAAHERTDEREQQDPK
ncbi:MULTISPECIES: hypothetical protein [Methylocaldum]|jgi:hypothetical protein|uniref:hypothetical protein n=2 Tax=Methylocaldum TaxID=73778 RepID=UPI000A327354